MKKKRGSFRQKENRLIEDEVVYLSSSKGNGILRRQIWVDPKGDVLKYNLAYINHRIFNGDNGRALGYDNAHGYHNRHYFGKIENIDLKDFSEIESKFQNEFEVLHEEAKRKK